MAKTITIAPWGENNQVKTSVQTTRELCDNEKKQVSYGIKYACISPCVPGWKERSTQQIKEVLKNLYGADFANLLLDVKYI